MDTTAEVGRWVPARTELAPASSRPGLYPPGGVALVVDDGGPLTAAVIDALTATGLQPRIVALPESAPSAPFGAPVVQLPDWTDEALAAGIDALLGDGGRADVCVQIATGNPSGADLVRRLTHALLVLKHVEPFLRTGGTDRRSYVAVVRSTDASWNPWPRALDALARTIGHELPQLFTRVVDLAAECAVTDVAAVLAAELTDTDTAVVTVVYTGRGGPRPPRGDLLFVDRLMSIDPHRRGDPHSGLAGIAEYDAPDEPWYVADNGHPYLPNLWLMEASGQAAGLLGIYAGTMLAHPERDYVFRALGGEATLHRAVDVCGRTVRQHAVLRSSDAIGELIVQRYTCRLAVGDDVFYSADFTCGFVTEEALTRGSGLDGGLELPSWLDRARPRPATVRPLDLAALAAAHPTLRLPTGRLALLDAVEMVPDGGEYGLGYLRGHHLLRPDDWYFPLHFYRRPVLPGSFGMEAAFTALRAFAIATGLGDGIPDPVFAPVAGLPFHYEYRGQLVPTDGRMDIEVHVRQIDRGAVGIRLVGDASIWKGALRIHRCRNAAVLIGPGPGRTGGAR